MRFFHTKCGHELETFTVKADCPIPDVGVVGEIPSPIGWTKPKAFQRAFCPPDANEKYLLVKL